ncbi:MAG: hypothetical protein NPIRA02_06550 [Nitrospirales bacterium]|nr:MAG: hypothetical protein NPIRA02_06550 [Nitrospirales bacterium]
MPSEVFEITSYRYYQFSSRENVFKAVISCSASGGKTVYVYFDGGEHSLAEARKNGNSYFLYYRYADMANIIDMLRNEKPIWMVYVPEGSNNSRISTSQEPVGEGELP